MIRARALTLVLPLVFAACSSNGSEGSASTSTSPDITTSTDRFDCHLHTGDAVRLARERGCLTEAADQMEEAFNKWPDLRDEYQYQVRIWRRGISM